MGYSRAWMQLVREKKTWSKKFCGTVPLIMLYSWIKNVFLYIRLTSALRTESCSMWTESQEHWTAIVWRTTLGRWGKLRTLEETVSWEKYIFWRAIIVRWWIFGYITCFCVIRFLILTILSKIRRYFRKTFTFYSKSKKTRWFATYLPLTRHTFSIRLKMAGYDKVPDMDPVWSVISWLPGSGPVLRIYGSGTRDLKENY